MVAIIFRSFLDDSTNINSNRMVSEVMNSSKYIQKGTEGYSYCCAETLAQSETIRFKLSQRQHNRENIMASWNLNYFADFCKQS